MGQAAVQGFSMGAASRLQASQGEPKPLGPKAQARLERHPEIAEAMGGPTGPVAEMERRTAGIQAPEVDDEGLGRH